MRHLELNQVLAFSGVTECFYQSEQIFNKHERTQPGHFARFIRAFSITLSNRDQNLRSDESRLPKCFSCQHAAPARAHDKTCGVAASRSAWKCEYPASLRHLSSDRGRTLELRGK